MNAYATRQKEKGFILVVVFLVVLLVAIFSLVFFSRHNTFLQASERNRNKIVAFNMAENGVDFAITQLNTDLNYGGTPVYVPMNGTAGRGGFTVSVTREAANPMVRIIQATGFAPDNNSASRAYQSVPVVVYGMFRPSNLFDFAVFAENTLTLTGTDKMASVDSYDSRLGPYTSGGSDGDIGTNSIAAGAITLNGKTIVQGDALIGPSGDPDDGVDVGPNATITGTTGTLTELQDYPTPSTTLPSSGDLSVTTGTQTLMPGTYHYDSLSISGDGTLSLTGEVIIYVSGPVDITGNGVVTADNLPTNLLIYVTTSDTVKVAGNGTFYGGIYAPNSLVKNDGNGGIFGAVVSKDYVQTGNSSIHFDLAMTEVESDQRLVFEVTAWQEQNSLTWNT